MKTKLPEVGSRWRRNTSQLVPEYVTITGATRTSDTFGRIFVSYTTETATGSFYGLFESWAQQFVPSE